MRRLSIWVLPVLASVSASCGLLGADDDAVPSTTESVSVTRPLETVFPLPPGDASELVPYELIDDEVMYAETASVLIDGPTIDEAVAFYVDHLTGAGYDLAEPTTTADGKVTLSASSASEPGTTVVVAVGPSFAGSSSLLISQQLIVTRTEGPVEPDDETAGSDDDAADVELVAGTGPGRPILIDWWDLGSSPEVERFSDRWGSGYVIETDPARDGFHLRFQFYLDWGSWRGELGRVAIGCEDDGDIAPGICAFYDPDGAGPEPALGADYLTWGEVEIDRLDLDGYSITVRNLVFSDGTSFRPFTMYPAPIVLEYPLPADATLGEDGDDADIPGDDADIVTVFNAVGSIAAAQPPDAQPSDEEPPPDDGSSSGADEEPPPSSDEGPSGGGEGDPGDGDDDLGDGADPSDGENDGGDPGAGTEPPTGDGGGADPSDGDDDLGDGTEPPTGDGGDGDEGDPADG